MQTLKLEIRSWSDFVKSNPQAVYTPEVRELNNELAACMAIQTPRDIHDALYSIDTVYSIGFQLYLCFGMKCDAISSGSKTEMRVFAKISADQLNAIKEYDQRKREEELRQVNALDRIAIANQRRNILHD